MRKYRYRQLNKYIQLFKKLYEAIILELTDENGSVQKACEYLELAQQKAIDMGTVIEETEGEKHPTVSYLEEFCEVVYEIHEELLSDCGMSRKSANNRLNTIINKIEKSYKDDIAVEQVVVFLPYKVSMWDSFESVWEAACKDDNCKPYVIPIPYYERDINGNTIEEKWEGDKFPDYIEITRYDEFNFIGIHPDIIFIHNPYDDYNLVTSVDPFFYSRNIKAYTECLVYIPYFASVGTMGESMSLLPAYIHSDFIIVQSEEMKNCIATDISREKILPLGSPKFDSVINKCKGEIVISKEWENRIKNKKVYFYNTSLKGMLDDPIAFLKKMSYVFGCFRNRNNACLIWRPHPLMLATFESMHPNLTHIYIDLRERFIGDNIGIYDDTAFVEDSIALSDTYIGDAKTTVPALFGVVGKEIFILDNQINEETVSEIDTNIGEDERIKSGFVHHEKGIPYFCHEDRVITLPKYLDGDIEFNKFDSIKSKNSFLKVNKNLDGTCGREVYNYLKEI